MSDGHPKAPPGGKSSALDGSQAATPRSAGLELATLFGRGKATFRAPALPREQRRLSLLLARRLRHPLALGSVAAALLAVVVGAALQDLSGLQQTDKAASLSPPNAAAAPVAPTPLRGIPEIIDTTTLRLDGKVVNLFGVEWSRGGQGGDLSRYIAGRSVDCTPAALGQGYRCLLDGHDLSEVVLYNGGAQAAPDAPQELIAAEQRARAARIGVWRK